MNLENAKKEAKDYFDGLVKKSEIVLVDTYGGSDPELKIEYRTIWNNKDCVREMRLKSSLLVILTVEDLQDLLCKFLKKCRKDAGYTCKDE